MRKHRKITGEIKNSIFFIAIILLINFAFYDLGIPQEKTAKIDEFIKKCNEYRIFNGAVLVAENSKIIYENALGPANREWNVPNRINTKFMIGSVSKQFTAMLILQLVEEGKISLDDKLSKIIPYYPREKADKITVHHLLCHSSGIPLLTKIYENFYTDVWVKEYSDEEYIKLFCDHEHEFEPGSRFMYNSGGYYLLAVIIEEVTGKKFNDVIKEKIFDPLQMTGTGCNDGITIVPEMATGYEYWNFRFMKTGYSSPSFHKGAGSVYSNAGDLFKWWKALQTEKLISQKYLDLMFKQHISLFRAGYGYGWVIGKRDLAEIGEDMNFIEHNGYYPGFNCVFTWLTDKDDLILTLTNSAYNDYTLIRNGIIQILHGKEYSLSRPLSLVLNDCRNLADIKNVIKDFKNSRNSFQIRRDAINGLGFYFLLDGKNDMGLEVLKFNANEYPNESYVYESLGEAYFMTGNKELALKNFERTVELNPKNKYAVKKLNELK
jgi:CubicO group peptidase (beta-lactamase class C family)